MIADQVIHFDLWWNLAVEGQATNTVEVIKLIVKGN
jgi:SNF2 family DNA or RNA helicase